MKGPALLMVILTAFIVHQALAADIQMQDSLNVTGSVTASSFNGSGAGLTHIPGSAITNDSITAGQIADSTITPAKLSKNSVTPAKISFYNKVAIIAASGGDYDNPETAMTAYSDWCPSPAGLNPCLLKIMPGVYTVTSSVQMQQFIDIEGSGENSTIIQGSIASSSAGTVNGANNAEIRFLTVKNTGPGSDSSAIYNNSASPKMTNVTATASGGSGVHNYNSSSPVMTNVTAKASGGTINRGVFNSSSSSPVMTNVNATGPGGTTYNYGVFNATSGTVKINHSLIRGATRTIYNNSGVTTLVGNTQLDGGVVHNEGDLTCAEADDENYMALSTACD